MIEVNNIYNGNCVDVMKNINDKSIDLTVTSPPYDNLRDYKGYTFDFENIAKELFRITKIGGVVVWVVGDQTIDGNESGTSFRQALYFKDIGFKLHDTMIYQKSSFANPSNNRYHQTFEFMFIFSKEFLKTFNPIMDRKNIYTGKTCWGKNTKRQKDGSFKIFDKKIYADYGKRFNIWKYFSGKIFNTNDELIYQHPAVFPDKLAYDHIISWSNKGDLVLDPMCGSGTTCITAIKTKRNYIGIDISKKYCALTQKRIDNYNKQIKLF